MAETKTKKTSKKNDTELIEKYQQMVYFVKNVMQDIDSDIKRAKLVLSKLERFDPSDFSTLAVDAQTEEAIGEDKLQTYTDEDAQVVEWTFDGYFMIGADQKKYPVPLNYASKTKLVPGDILKLKILSDGKFIYKLIRPIERQHVRAILSKTDDNKFIAITDDSKTYFLNQAAVTFFKGKSGDELYVVINADGSWWFAAIEAIIKK